MVALIPLGGLHGPWWPGGIPSPPQPPATPVQLTIDLPLSLHYRFPRQEFAFAYQHEREVFELCEVQVVPLRPLRWRRESQCLELALKLLVAGVEEGGRGFLVAADVSVYSRIGPALAVAADPPSVHIQAASIDDGNRYRITGSLAIGGWSCTVTRRARFLIDWPDEDSAGVTPLTPIT